MAFNRNFNFLNKIIQGYKKTNLKIQQFFKPIKVQTYVIKEINP